MTRPLVSAFALALAVLTTSECSGPSRERESTSPIDTILRAARGQRVTEARIVGMPWATGRGNKIRFQSAIDQFQFDGVAEAILNGAQQSPTAESLHAAAITNMLLGHSADAIAQLQAASRLAPVDARIWNDIAVARCLASGKEAAGLPSALAAVDRALLSVSDLPEALYNRALILTQLGLVSEARDAWQLAIQHEFDGNWLKEAQAHLEPLSPGGKPPLAFELTAALARHRVGDSYAVLRLVKERYEDVRATSESINLSTWAEAVIARRPSQRLLADLGVIADAIATVGGDRLMCDVVQQIEASPNEQLSIATAELAYRRARLRYRDRYPGSDAALRSAANSLARWHTPLEYVARYYAANAMFDRNDVDSARVVLEAILRDIDARRYPSLAAGVEKQLGLCYGFRGLWSTSLLHLDRSQRIFATAGETVNAAFTEAILGEAYDRIGQVERGWQHRRAALEVLSRLSPDQRSAAVLVGAVHAETMRADWEAALSLIPIAHRQADAVRDPVLMSELMVREVRVLLVARGRASALSSLMHTKRVAAGVSDPSTRQRIEADLDVAESEVIHDNDPKRAIALTTRAIDFYNAHGFGILLPDAYLERGRAYLVLQNRDKALEDFQCGLTRIEDQRANTGRDMRTTIFDTAAELIGETAALLIDDQRFDEAYIAIERARARTLVEALGTSHHVAPVVSLQAVRRSLPANAAVIEYVLLQRSIVAFCVRREDMQVIRINVDPESLRSLTLDLNHAIRARGPLSQVQQVASTLYTALVAPVTPYLAGIQTLYVVPDRFLYGTPFSALFETSRREYLMERYNIVIAPSSAYLLRQKHRREGSVLLVSDPSRFSESSLAAARRETAAIARLYPAPVIIEGSAATIDRFQEAARNSVLIHYAGHAGVDDAAGGFLTLAPSARDDGRLDASAISRLHLVNTRVVVLSACATMRGSATRIEGMPSISRAFLAAGASAVLGMLWEIHDEDAARLLLKVHEHLSVHGSPSAALRAAQLDFARHGAANLRHPASWAFGELLGAD
jgi:CHAT domain-containing protein